MAVYGDPAAIRELAQRVDVAAADARHEAAVVRGALDVAWVSAGASRYRQRLVDEAAHVERAAEELDQAAQALRDHAAAVEERLAQIAEAERWFRSAVSEARSLLDRAVDVVLSVPRILTVRPPTPGTLDWLDFTRGLGR